MRKTMTALILTLGLAVSVTGCGGGSTAAKEGPGSGLLPLPVVETSDGLRIDGELVADKTLFEAAKNDTVKLYSGTGKEAEDLTDARFSAETGIKVDLTRLPTNKLAERALSEAGAGKLEAGLIRMTDVRIAREFTSKNIFVPYRTPSHDVLVAQEAGVRDTFVNCYYFVNAMAYNSASVEGDAPTKWEDLADPKYKGKLGVNAITTGGTLNALAHFQISTFGPEFLQAQGALQPRIFDSTATQVDALARGEITVGPVSFNNAFATELAGAPIKLVIPEKGVSASEGVIGMTAKGLQSPAAQVFMNWTMSKAGQRFAAAQGFAPSRTDIEPVKAGEYQLPKADSPQFHLFTEEDFARYADADEAVWKRAFNYMG